MNDHRGEDDPIEDELTDDEMDEVVGGLTTVFIPLCKHCQQRIAIHNNSVCAVCYLKFHKPYGGQDSSI